MTFNNGYPATYQPMTYSHQNYTMNNQNVPANSIVWVQGEAAKAITQEIKDFLKTLYANADTKEEKEIIEQMFSELHTII